MKKLFGTLFLILITTSGLLWVFRANIASHLISRQIGANVLIEQFNPTPWGLMMKNSIIYHPETQTTLKIGRLRLNTPFLGIFKKEINVEKLELKDVAIISHPEKIKINSIESIFSLVDGVAGNNQPKKETLAHKKLIIHEIIATNVALEIGNPFGKGSLVKTTVPSLRLKNINQGDPITLEALIDYLTKTFLARGKPPQ